MNRDEARKCIAIFLAAYPNLRELSESVLDGIEEVWASMLAGVPFDVGKRAVQGVLVEQTIPAFPAIGKVVQAAGMIMLDPIPALEAWEGVRAVCRRFDDAQEREALAAMSPLTAAVVRRMGWDELYWALFNRGERANVLRREFMQLYEATLAEEAALRVMPHGLGEGAAIPALAAKAMPGAGE